MRRSHKVRRISTLLECSAKRKAVLFWSVLQRLLSSVDSEPGTVQEMFKIACTLHLWNLFLWKETHSKQWTLQISKWLSIYWLDFIQVMWQYWGSNITFGGKEQERTQIRLNLWELLNSLLSLSKCFCYSNVSFLIFKVTLMISLLSSCWNSAMWLKMLLFNIII